MSSPPPSLIPPSTVIPFPLPWGQTGCCPPGGMDALMKCYCDIQAASAFIGQIMIDQINNNPAVTEAIIAAIEKSGSSLPMIGVTDGSNAQPGQVGEWVSFEVSAPILTTPVSQTVTMGILQPGDWDCFAGGFPQVGIHDAAFAMPVAIPGFSNNMYTAFASGVDAEFIIPSTIARASISVPSLITFNLNTNGGGAGSAAGNFLMIFSARRAR